MAKSRFRLQFKFWLDMNCPDDERVADQIERLKNDRSFTSAVRDGIMLVSELRQGRADLLLQLYPWLASELAQRGGGAGGDDDSLQAQIERLEQLLLAQNAGPKMAREDEGTPKVTIKKAKSPGKSADNFLASAFAVAGIQ